MNSEQRKSLRLALVDAGLVRLSYTGDHTGNGEYSEWWSNHPATGPYSATATHVTISWGERDAPA